jgi:hypothetical protein
MAITTATPTDINALLQQTLTPTPEPIIPSQTVDGQRVIGETVIQAEETNVAGQQDAAKSRTLLEQTLSEIAKGKEAVAVRTTLQQEQSALAEQESAEVQQRTAANRNQVSNINNGSSLTLYQQALEVQQRTSEELAEAQGIIASPTTTLMDKVGAFFRRDLFLRRDSQEASASLANIQNNRLARVQDYQNSLAAAQVTVGAENAELRTSLARRSQVTDSVLQAVKDNITFNSAGVNALATQMGIDKTAMSNAITRINVLKDQDAISNSAVDQQLRNAQVEDATMRFDKAKAAAKDEAEFFVKEDADHYQAFRDSSNDANLPESFKEFSRSVDFRTKKGGQIPEDWQDYQLYRAGRNLPSTDLVTTALTAQNAGLYDPADPSGEARHTTAVLNLTQKAISQHNTDELNMQQQNPQHKPTIWSMDTLDATALKSLNTTVTNQFAAVAEDATPFIQSGDIQIANFQDVIAGADVSTASGKKIMDIYNGLLTPQELADIQSGKMGDILSHLTPEDPANSVGTNVASIIAQMNKAGTEALRPEQYAGVMAKHFEAQRRLHVGAGLPTMRKLQLRGVKNMALPSQPILDRPFNLTNPADWTLAIKQMQLRDKIPTIQSLSTRRSL